MSTSGSPQLRSPRRHGLAWRAIATRMSPAAQVIISRTPMVCRAWKLDLGGQVRIDPARGSDREHLVVGGAAPPQRPTQLSRGTSGLSSEGGKPRPTAPTAMEGVVLVKAFAALAFSPGMVGHTQPVRPQPSDKGIGQQSSPGRETASPSRRRQSGRPIGRTLSCGPLENPDGWAFRLTSSRVGLQGRRNRAGRDDHRRPHAG